MNEMFRIMAWPFAACLVLTGIHAYLGLHVLEREVIFVDLALAQIAALGAAVALAAGHLPDSPASYAFSLAFTVAGAAVFAATRFRRPRVPQEAIIGIAYTVSAALLFLVLSRAGEGDEHIRESLVGNILVVSRSEVLRMLAIYSAVGALHIALRRRFFTISREPAKAFELGWNVRFWDFLFYASFGVVVTSSVRVAGVLLVFTFLIVPAAAAALFADSSGKRLAIGWVFGFAASVAGLLASYCLDLPTGASVVCAFGAFLALAAAVRAFRKSV